MVIGVEMSLVADFEFLTRGTQRSTSGFYISPGLDSFTGDVEVRRRAKCVHLPVYEHINYLGNKSSVTVRQEIKYRYVGVCT
jgi:hypothetical protein